MSSNSISSHKLLGFGTYKLEGDTCYQMVLSALNAGIRYIDTAKLYRNQQYVGRAVADFLRENPRVTRSDIFICSKVSTRAIQRGQIAKDIDLILTELGTYVDLLLLHSPVGSDLALQASWKHLIEYKRGSGGMIKQIGVSNYDIPQLQVIMQVSKTKCAVNQIEISPFWTRQKLVYFCRQHGIEVVAHSSLTKGHKFDDPTLMAMAALYNRTPAQILLQWALQKQYRVIPKASSLNHLRENTTLNFTMSSLDMDTLDGLDQGFATHPQYRFEMVEETAIVSIAEQLQEQEIVQMMDFSYAFVEGLLCG